MVSLRRRAGKQWRRVARGDTWPRCYPTVLPSDVEAFAPVVAAQLAQGLFATEARRELHKAGWTDSLARLASHLAQA
jgi:hypothetical protein